MPEPLNRSHIKAPGGAGPRLFAALARAATSKTSIPLARRSRHDDHANAATPDSYPDCRSFPIQIAALQLQRQKTLWPDNCSYRSEAQRQRHIRLMGLSIVDRTSPVLIDRDDAMAVLDMSPGVFDRRVRDGDLEDMVLSLIHI